MTNGLLIINIVNSNSRKMKKILLALGALLFSLPGAQAQEYGEDSVRCRENLYIYYELARKKQYLEAYEGWDYVINNCPASSKNNFVFGPYILKAKIDEAEKASDAAAEAEFKARLLKVYDDRNQYYPGQEGYVYARKALDVVSLYPDSASLAYELFEKALELDGPEQSAAFYNYFFITAARLFNQKEFETEDVFKAYNLVIEGIESNTDKLNKEVESLSIKRDSTETGIDSKEEKQLAKDERELERYNKVAGNIEKILAPIATCEKMGVLYNDESFAANRQDTLWLKRATKMLQKERKNSEGDWEDCTDLPIFFKISDALYNLQPSAPSARAMFVMAYRDNNYSKANQYIKEAIEFEVDPLKRSADYLKLASVLFKQGSLASAKNAALKSAQLDRANGDPYVLIAQLYAAADGSCGNNVFEKKAVYWAAIDKLNYAKSIDPSVSGKANRLIAAYQKQLPDKGVSFQLGHNSGESYTIGCWINETVTVTF